MKRLPLMMLATAAIAGAVIMFVLQDVGKVHVSIGAYSFETSLLIIGGILFGLLFVILLLDYIFDQLRRLHWLFGSNRSASLADTGRNALVQGYIELTEGHFAIAEKLLLQNVTNSEYTMLAYLGAARAAQQLGAHDRRDKYIKLALDAEPEADIAIGLTQAEMLLDHQQYEQARKTLIRLIKYAPHHPHLLNLLAQTYRMQSDWNRLHDLLPELSRSEAQSADDMRSLETDIWRGLISDFGRSHDATVLINLWEQAPRSVQGSAEVVELYADQLVRAQATGEAEKVLREQLCRQWNESVIEHYAQLEVLASGNQIATAEGWLRQHPHNAWLLLALGKMFICRSQWGRARSYLEASLSIRPMPHTYLALAQLLEEHMDKHAQAQEYYRQGLYMLTGNYGDALLANAKADFSRVLTKPKLKAI